MDAPNGCAGVLIGGGSHGASVQDDDFGLGGSFGTLQSAVAELALDGRAIRLSSTATKVLYIVSGIVVRTAALKARSAFPPFGSYL